MKDSNHNKSREHKLVRSYNPVLSSLGKKNSNSVVYLMADPVCIRCSAFGDFYFFLNQISSGKDF